MKLAVADGCIVLRNAELRVPHEDAEQDDKEHLEPDSKQREADCREHAAAAVDDDAVTLWSPNADDAAVCDGYGRPVAPASDL